MLKNQKSFFQARLKAILIGNLSTTKIKQMHGYNSKGYENELLSFKKVPARRNLCSVLEPRL